MTVVSVNLYNALKEAGVKDDLASKASAEVAESSKLVLEQDKKIDALANKIDTLTSKVDVAIKSLKEELRTKFNLLISLNVAVLAGLVLSLFLR